MTGETDKLIGVWKSDHQDPSSLDSYGETTLEFRADHSLIYTIHTADRDQVMFLTFQVDEMGFIVTDQPSSPRQEKTAYEITSDGKLILVLENKKSRYMRVSL